MLTDERRMELSDVLRPAAPPREIDNVYTADQKERLLDVVRTEGPWKLIIAQHFASADELMATMSGMFPEGFEPSLDLFLTPTFRGYLANYGAVLYPELHDCFYNEQFLNMAKSYWGAEYAKPELMLFNINGPCANRDPGHLDSPSFRGVRHENAPTWLCSVMGKSGLFTDYLIKMAQVITWFSLDDGKWLHLLARRSAEGAAAGATADQQPRRGGAERDDGAPRRSQRPTRTTDSGRAGL